MTETDTANKPDSNGSVQPMPVLIALAIVAALLFIFWDGLSFMVKYWEKEEYNHGYLIPLVALYMLLLRSDELTRLKLSGSWLGLFLVAGGVMASAVGKISGTYQLSEYGFLMALFGVVVSAIGWSGFRKVWAPFVYLLFMIPLPFWLYQSLSAELQLISSELGVAVIRLFGVSVFLEGNVIDLGVFQLQVAEACNGLRYLFPLMSFGFLCAVIYLGPWWHRAIIFFSTIPVTILMNSFRIGVIGVLVDNFGIEQAEGFLHYFEGWIVFMACVAILFLEMAVLAKLSGQRLAQVFDVDVPTMASARTLMPKNVGKQSLAALGILAIGAAVTVSLQGYQDLIPDREQFNTFPLAIGDWAGRDTVITDASVLESLAADDYFLAEYRSRDGSDLIGLWIAYYEEQRGGNAVHSPKACLPGGGWQIESLNEHLVRGVGPAGEDHVINRSVIAKGDMRQLVYYWFVERGRIQTDEYAVKWYIFWDALTRNRTDGALVRVTTFVPDIEHMPAADARLEAFIRALNPKLAYHLPQDDATFTQMSAIVADD